MMNAALVPAVTARSGKRSVFMACPVTLQTPHRFTVLQTHRARGVRGAGPLHVWCRSNAARSVACPNSL